MKVKRKSGIAKTEYIRYNGNIIEEKKCPKCGKKEKLKNGFMKGKQQYKCKCCGCNYTGGRNGYPDHIKLRAIKYYLEGNGFRRIEQWMGVSHVSVINGLSSSLLNLRTFPSSVRKYMF